MGAGSRITRGRHQPGITMKIPLTSLSDDALAGIIDSFVLREGTDYGAREHSHDLKCVQVLAQLQAGEAEIDYDPETDSIDIRPVSKNGREN